MRPLEKLLAAWTRAYSRAGAGTVLLMLFTARPFHENAGIFHVHHASTCAPVPCAARIKAVRGPLQEAMDRNRRRAARRQTQGLQHSKIMREQEQRQQEQRHRHWWQVRNLGRASICFSYIQTVKQGGMQAILDESTGGLGCTTRNRIWIIPFLRSQQMGTVLATTNSS